MNHDEAAVRCLLDTLAALRRRRGLSKAEVARRMHTTRAVVARLEEQSGAGGGLQMSTVLRYARAVDSPLGLLAVLPTGVKVFGAVEDGVAEAGPEGGVTRAEHLDAVPAGDCG